MLFKMYLLSRRGPLTLSAIQVSHFHGKELSPALFSFSSSSPSHISPADTCPTHSYLCRFIQAASLVFAFVFKFLLCGHFTRLSVFLADNVINKWKWKVILLPSLSDFRFCIYHPASTHFVGRTGNQILKQHHYNGSEWHREGMICTRHCKPFGWQEDLFSHVNAVSSESGVTKIGMKSA